MEPRDPRRNASPASARPLLPPASPGDVKLAHAVLGFAVAIGVLAIVHAALAYAGMPARVPVHFDASGTPDAWGPRSFPNVMTLPVMALLVPALTAATALMTARAPMALRAGPDAPDVESQREMRRDVVRLLAAVSTLCTVLLALIAHGSVEVARGRDAGMGWAPIAVGALMFVVTAGGALRLVVRHGFTQPARRSAAQAAREASPEHDDRHWRWGGAFYVNADDPALMVEKRLGVGYTFNFAHRGGVAFMAALGAVFVAIFGLVAWSMLAG